MSITAHGEAQPEGTLETVSRGLKARRGREGTTEGAFERRSNANMRTQKELARTVRSSKNPSTGEGGAGERQAAGETMKLVRTEAVAEAATMAGMLVALAAVLVAVAASGQ